MVKSFKGNPTLKLLSEADKQTETQEEQEEPKMQEVQKNITHGNPAPPPEGFKINPEYIEVKSRRLQLVLQPSLFSRVKERASSAGLSVNEYVSRILDRATREGE